jgi:hypothetical protein
MNIWLENGNINGFQVTSELGQILRSGRFDEFREIINLLEQETFISKIAQRIKFLNNQIAGIQHVSEEAKNNSLYEQTLLKSFGKEKTEVDDFSEISNKCPGLYFLNQKGITFNSFEADFLNYSNDMKTSLSERGLNKDQTTRNQEKIRIIDHAIFHEFNHNFYAVSDRNGFYDTENSARLAKLSYLNFRRTDEKEVIDEAIILPIDHACNNYYHNLSETFAGLRFINHFPADLPIIYTEDRFEILDFLSARLGIKRERFISIKACGNLCVKRAFLLYQPNFYWDADMYDFFKKISYPQTDNRKIYISRRKSGRGPNNESDIENMLEAEGFNILFPEELNFEEQVLAFSNASILISPHGAGLTNIAFMPEGSSLIEIFDETFIAPDYYLRSRPNKIRYNCLILREKHVDITELMSFLS